MKNVLEFLEASAARVPDKCAFSDSEISLSFAQTLSYARACGSLLLRLFPGVRRRPAVVLIDRKALFLPAFFGVLYAGNFYVPVDNKTPAKRLESMLETLNPFVVIAQRSDAALLEQCPPACETLLLDDLFSEAPDEGALSTVRAAQTDTDPIYATFTSGSTGAPKAVVVCHRSVLDLMAAFECAFSFLDASCVFANQASFDYDASAKDIYCTVKYGATAHILPRMLFMCPEELLAEINRLKVNTCFWVAGVLRMVTNLNALEKNPPRFLRAVLFSGEVMPNAVLNDWRKHLPATTFVNLYGPTEATCNCTYYIADRAFRDEEPLPIGRAFSNTRILLLDEQDREVPRGEKGEICVLGSGLSLGYCNNPDMTARAYVQNPQNAAFPETMYRTGDLGCENERGELMFVSRKDFQIKHNGHRVELGEIELCAAALEFVDAAVCLYDTAGADICLFYQAKAKDDRAVQRGLREFLPAYMLPGKLFHYEKLPLTSTGKIDRVLLAKTRLQPS